MVLVFQFAWILVKKLVKNPSLNKFINQPLQIRSLPKVESEAKLNCQKSSNIVIHFGNKTKLTSYNNWTFELCLLDLHIHTERVPEQILYLLNSITYSVKTFVPKTREKLLNNCNNRIFIEKKKTSIFSLFVEENILFDKFLLCVYLKTVDFLNRKMVWFLPFCENR